MKAILDSLITIAQDKIAKGQDVGGSGFAKVVIDGNTISCEVKPYGGATNRNHYKKLFYKNGKRVKYQTLIGK